MDLYFTFIKSGGRLLPLLHSLPHCYFCHCCIASFYNSTNARDVASLSLPLLQKDFSALAEFFLFRLSPRQFIVYDVTVYDSGVIFLFYDTR